MKMTTRQASQLHSVLKSTFATLSERDINRAPVNTLATCSVTRIPEFQPQV
jgi:hypothetical protein